MWQIGETLAWSIEVRDDTGALADPGTTPTATVSLPGGTTAAATVTKTATGKFTAALVATLLGRYVVVWTASGANSGGFPHTDHADVLDLSRLILPIGQAKAALNLPATMVADDDELTLTIAATTAVIEARIGPVLAATEVERRSGGGQFGIALYKDPTSVTSVVEDGATLTEGADWCLDEHGILWRGSRPGAGAWSSRGAANVTVTYTVGSPVIDPAVLLAASILVQHMWRTQTTTRPALGATSPDMTVVAGYLVPNRVLELLAAVPDRRMPGFA